MTNGKHDRTAFLQGFTNKVSEVRIFQSILSPTATNTPGNSFFAGSIAFWKSKSVFQTSGLNDNEVRQQNEHEREFWEDQMKRIDYKQVHEAI